MIHVIRILNFLVYIRCLVNHFDQFCLERFSLKSYQKRMKIDIQTFTDSDDSLRFTFYESWFNKSIIVVKEERFSDEDWSVVNSLAIPKSLFGVLKATVSAPTACANRFVVTDDTNYRSETIEDRLQLPLHVRKSLLDRDCEEIPLYENQTGYFNDVETLEWFWDVPKEDGKSDGSEAETKEFFPNVSSQSTIHDCDGGIFISETPNDPAALVTSPCVINTDEDNSMHESPSTPEKTDPMSLTDCPPAPKKRRIIRRPIYPMHVQPLDFSEF